MAGKMPKFDEGAIDETSVNVGGYSFKPVHLAFILPLLSGVSGAIYFVYDAYNRFLDVEESVIEVLETNGRVQALEQTIGDNDVSRLGSQLTQINTQMVTILEQQRTLLDLRSKVERAEILTNGIGGKLDTYEMEIEDLWKAFDELVTNPIR
jgi:tRNA A37 threonylcarbamoyladenosine dehydratase